MIQKNIDKASIEKILEELSPNLKADGGDIKLVEITPENVIKVQFLGACSCCPGAMMTLKYYIERAVKERIPEVKEVVMV